jgi:DNA-binding Xre family transcriptional regulator
MSIIVQKLVTVAKLMQTFEAFDRTLIHFNITNRDLHHQTGVHESSISRFRRGERDLHVATLEKLILALPLEAQQFYYFNCMVSDLREIHTNNLERLIKALPPEDQEHFLMNCVIKEMSNDGMATMLQAIAANMRKSTELRALDERIPA